MYRNSNFYVFLPITTWKTALKSRRLLAKLQFCLDGPICTEKRKYNTYVPRTQTITIFFSSNRSLWTSIIIWVFSTLGIYNFAETPNNKKKDFAITCALAIMSQYFSMLVALLRCTSIILQKKEQAGWKIKDNPFARGNFRCNACLKNINSFSQLLYSLIPSLKFKKEKTWQEIRAIPLRIVVWNFDINCSTNLFYFI